MTHKEFEKLDSWFMDQVNHVLQSKGKHYSPSQERFSNFEKAAALGKTTPLDEMLAQMRKHVVGWFDSFNRFRESIPKNILLEHGSDIINFIRLIHGWVTSQQGENYEYSACDLPDCECTSPEDCIKRGGGGTNMDRGQPRGRIGDETPPGGIDSSSFTGDV